MTFEEDRTKEEAGLTNMIDSMIQQLIPRVEPQFVQASISAHHVLSTRAAPTKRVGSPSACSTSEKPWLELGTVCVVYKVLSQWPVN